MKAAGKLAVYSARVIRCDQPRALDIGSRNGRKIESLSAMITDEVLAKLATILD